jgi:hypothetical protein
MVVYTDCRSSETLIIGGHDLEIDAWLVSHRAAVFKPWKEVLALTDIE